MTENNAAPFEQLKKILKNMRSPELLDDHPWTQSLIVQEAVDGLPHLSLASPGHQLVSAIAALFPKMRPPAAPRRGKRLDPRWGEFGLLAALYFVPFQRGTAFPASLMEAWDCIDGAILFSVYGPSATELAEGQVQAYRLVGEEVEYGSASTLSDWQKKGLQRLAEIVLNRERFLSDSFSRPSVILRANGSQSTLPEPMVHGLAAFRKHAPLIRRGLWLGAFLLLAFGLFLGGRKAQAVYQRGQTLYGDLTGLGKLTQGPFEVEKIRAAGPQLRTLKGDLADFQGEVGPLLWLCPGLGWVPVYGGDLQAAPDLLALAGHLVNASDLSYQAAEPVFEALDSPDKKLDTTKLANLLLDAQPQLGEARHELDQALAERQNIPADRLSPRLGTLITGRLDPAIKLADDGLRLGMALPGLLGATEFGPKTYLLLAENEDELRPTGGFITSVGNLVLHDGQVISLDFEDVGNLDDWTKPYPAAPWQLQDYMNSPVLILRDANWFTDYPTSAMWAEYLYAYAHEHSEDGVIAFDQHFLVMLLGQLGPLQVAGSAGCHHGSECGGVHAPGQGASRRCALAGGLGSQGVHRGYRLGPAGAFPGWAGPGLAGPAAPALPGADRTAPAAAIR